MNNLDKNCFICNGNVFIVSSKHYLKCINCGHEIIEDMETQSFIINEALSEKSITKLNLLDKFKQNVLKECTIAGDFLLDIGSASGKFLYHNKDSFKNYMGIEVTDECIEFSRKRLGLKIKNNINFVHNTISVATFWHSLEHMPSKIIESILEKINSSSSYSTRVIISVPNNDSLQYALFKESYTYYDPTSHIHQFSVKSLGLLLQKHGFEKENCFYSFPYSAFGYLQGLMNKINKIHNYLYYRKKRGIEFSQNIHENILYDIYNYLLLVLFLVPSLLLSIYDFVYINKGAVITACYRIKKN
ncbi:MAG: class I SAM-dependent methyltransferase [Nitrospirae bacterium]|nr:class I SAM-dependent methyltransferase [Nitrospirota bacterium]